MCAPVKKKKNTFTCVRIDTGRDVEVAQGVSVMSNVAVSVCVLCAKLGGQQLTVSHQSRGPPATPAQMFQMVNRLIKQNRHDELIHLATGWTSEALPERLTGLLVYLQSVLDLVFVARQPWQAGAERLRVFGDLSSEQAVFWQQSLRPQPTHAIFAGRQQHVAHRTPGARGRERNRLTNQHFVEHLPILHFRNSRTSTSNTNT